MNSSPTSDEGRTGAAAPGPVDVEPINRRSFLGVLLGFGAVVVGAALSVPLVRFALHPLFETFAANGATPLERARNIELVSGER